MLIKDYLLSIEQREIKNLADLRRAYRGSGSRTLADVLMAPVGVLPGKACCKRDYYWNSLYICK